MNLKKQKAMLKDHLSLQAYLAARQIGMRQKTRKDVTLSPIYIVDEVG